MHMVLAPMLQGAQLDGVHAGSVPGDRIGIQTIVQHSSEHRDVQVGSRLTVCHTA